MAFVTIDWDGSATNLRAIFSSGASFLPTAGGPLQAHSGTAAHYHVSAASSVALSATTNRHTFTVPVPSVLPVVLDVIILDIVSGDIGGVGQIMLASDGSQYTEHDLVEADIYTDTTVTPWARVLMRKGTGGIGVGVELQRKAMTRAAGTNVTAETHIVGNVVG